MYKLSRYLFTPLQLMAKTFCDWFAHGCGVGLLSRNACVILQRQQQRHFSAGATAINEFRIMFAARSSALLLLLRALDGAHCALNFTDAL